MAEDIFARQRLLMGDAAMERLAQATVAVFGVGGVGSYVVEALARSGVGRLLLVDHDQVSPTNLNRQLIALHSTLGQRKVEAARERIRDINPAALVELYPQFITPENLPGFPLEDCSYVVDAIDTVSAKLALIQRCQELGVPILSSMGTGNKLDPARLELADISQTSVCPLARVMRRELKKRGILHQEVLYSQEPPISPAPAAGGEENPPGRRAVPGSTAFVPAAAGLIIAGQVVRRLASGVPGCPRCRALRRAPGVAPYPPPAGA